MCAGSSLPWIFQASALQRKELRLCDFRDHTGQFLLDELVACQRPVIKLLPHDDVGSRGFVAIHGGSDHTPANAVTRLREAGKRSL